MLLQKQKHQLTQQLAENAFAALQTHSHMPTTGNSQPTQFFAGTPARLEREIVDEGERGEEEEEGEKRDDVEEDERVGEGGEDKADKDLEDDTLGPPRAKKSRSQVRALDVQTLQVC